MAEDVAELALEAVHPIANHREVEIHNYPLINLARLHDRFQIWQKAKSKAKGGLGDLQNPENPRRRVGSDDEQTQYRDEKKRGSKYGKPNRRQSQYKDDDWREDNLDSNHRTTNTLSDRRQSHRSSAGRPRIQRRASSLDRGDFEKSRNGQRRRKLQIWRPKPW